MENLIGRREWMGLLAAGMAGGQEARVRARELGLAPGIYGTGALNVITDVKGVRVGHTTLVRGDDVRTGVTAILAHEGNLFQDKRPGGVFVGNAMISAGMLARGQAPRTYPPSKNGASKGHVAKLARS